MEQNSAKYHSLTEKDTLYIETEKTEFEILYRICFNQQGKKNVVFELKAVEIVVLTSCKAIQSME